MRRASPEVVAKSKQAIKQILRGARTGFRPTSFTTRRRHGEQDPRVHLGDDLKNRWVQFCRQSGLTPSAAIRQVIVKLTSATAGGIKPVSTQLPEPDQARVRIELRLSTSELSAIKATAEFEGVHRTNGSST